MHKTPLSNSKGTKERIQRKGTVHQSQTKYHLSSYSIVRIEKANHKGLTQNK